MDAVAEKGRRAGMPFGRTSLADRTEAAWTWESDMVVAGRVMVRFTLRRFYTALVGHRDTNGTDDIVTHRPGYSWSATVVAVSVYVIDAAQCRNDKI